MSAPRTLADQLRGWSTDQLRRLLSARPDLAEPPPRDTTQLASRAGTRASVLRALDQLSRLELVTLEAVTVGGGSTSMGALCARVNAAPEATQRATTRLRELALVWGDETSLRAVSILAEVLTTSVSGLGPPMAGLLGGYGPARVQALAQDLGLTPSGDRSADVSAIAEQLADPGNVAKLVSEVDDSARAILDQLDREGKHGTVARAPQPVRRSDPGAGPVDQLLARGLLVARNDGRVTVPREVAMSLRGGRTTRDPVDAPPALEVGVRGQGLIDRAAAGAAFELVRNVELILEHWGVDPPKALRTGGLGVRDLRSAGELLHVDVTTAATYLEVASSAGLLTMNDVDELGSAWLPTQAFDVWLASPAAERWAWLADAWVRSPRLIGALDQKGRDRAVNALAPDLERGWLPALKRSVLLELAALPEGRVLSPDSGTASLVARLRWLRPRRPAAGDQAVTRMVHEAAVVGVAGLGGLAAPGRALLTEEDPRHRAAVALDPLLPRPVAEMLLQADLTAVAPGPLAPELSRDLTTLADIESRGSATVYRFTEGSIRRGLECGWSAQEIRDFLESSSRTAVPQPLVYLVNDVARTFGTVRVGAAEAFVRSDDENALTELLHLPGAAALRLRRIAPTVLVTSLPVDELLPRLRELGSAPVAEAPDGTVVVARRPVFRARPSHGGRAAPGPRADVVDGADRLTAVVTAIRAGDRAAARRSPHRPDRRPSATELLAELREAADAKLTVSIGYLDKQGIAGARLVDPIHVHGGHLSAYDHRSQEVRLFAVHRITGLLGDPTGSGNAQRRED